MHELLSVGLGRAWALRPVEILFHAFVADLLVRRMRVVEPVHGFRVICLGQISNGVLFVLFIDGPRDHSGISLVGEVRLMAIAHSDRVIVVVLVLGAHKALESREPVLQVDVLMRHLFDYIDVTASLTEAFVLLDRVFLVLERGIPLLRVKRGWRRGRALEVDGAAREPGKLSSAPELIRRRVLLVREHDLGASHTRQVVLGGRGTVQV